jgi:hypothetical protein
VCRTSFWGGQIRATLIVKYFPTLVYIPNNHAAYRAIFGRSIYISAPYYLLTRFWQGAGVLEATSRAADSVHSAEGGTVTGRWR